MADATRTPARRPAESPNSSRRSGIAASRLGLMNRTRSRWLRPRNESSKEAGTEEATERDEVRFAAPARSDVVVAAATIAADSANARPSGRTRRRGKRPRLPGAETDDDEVEWVNEPGAKSQNSALSQSGEAEFLKDDSGGGAVNGSRRPEPRHRHRHRYRTNDVGCPTSENRSHPKSIALSRYKRVSLWLQYDTAA